MTVVAATALLADALSTAFYVMGAQASLDYCRVRPEIGMIMLCPGNRGGKIETYSEGLARDELTMDDV